MKKIIFISLTIISLNAYAQPWLGMGIGNTVNANAGILVKQIEISAAYQHPFSRADKPAIASLSIGKQLLLSNYDEDNFSLTTSAGVAFHSYKDMAAYNSGESDKITKVKEVKAIYGMEIGKDKYLGRYYINIQYSNRLMYGAGIKFFFR